MSSAVQICLQAKLACVTAHLLIILGTETACYAVTDLIWVAHFEFVTKQNDF